MRLFAISDLHTDIPANLEWVRNLNSNRWVNDALIVAGDVSENIAVVVETFNILKKKFAEVFFVAGNHDVWDPINSLDKLELVYDMVRKIGVRCEPALVDGRLWVVPLESWHCFEENDIASSELDLARLRLWRDFDKCSWLPSALGSLSTKASEVFNPLAKLAESRAVAQLMLERNEAAIERVYSLQSVRHLPVVTFSHFVPRFDLNPKFVRFKELKAVSVCPQLDSQIRSIRSRLHIFGHTHHRTSQSIEGIQYIQYPLGYPTEGAYCPRFPDIASNEIFI